MKKLISFVFISTLLLGCAMTTTPPAPVYPSAVTELTKIDTVVGAGTIAAAGSTTRVHYTGWLFVPGENGGPGEFTIGQRRVIAGWEQGVAGMAIGGKRTLIIPPEMGYGARGAGGVIPPNATLVFEIELLAIK
jgi:FKBP-type peptidyl-prolyl cis-trans isomerase